MHGHDFPGQTGVPETIEQLRIDYPVAHDEAKVTWRAYGSRFRPSHVLIGPDGSIVNQGVGLVTTPETRALIAAHLPE